MYKKRKVTRARMKILYSRSVWQRDVMFFCKEFSLTYCKEAAGAYHRFGGLVVLRWQMVMHVVD